MSSMQHRLHKHWCLSQETKIFTLSPVPLLYISVAYLVMHTPKWWNKRHVSTWWYCRMFIYCRTMNFQECRRQFLTHRHRGQRIPWRTDQELSLELVENWLYIFQPLNTKSIYWKESFLRGNKRLNPWPSNSMATKYTWFRELKASVRFKRFQQNVPANSAYLDQWGYLHKFICKTSSST